MSRIEMAKLEFRNAVECAVEKRRIEDEVRARGVAEGTGPRGEELRLLREIWPGILYCCGRSQQLGIEIEVAHVSNIHADHDVLARWTDDGEPRVTPIQIKELPNDPRANNTLQSTIDGLRRYGDSWDLTVCIYVARPLEFDVDCLVLPEDLRIGELWLLFATEPTLDSWCLLGDLLDEREQWNEIRFSVTALGAPN